MTEPNEETVTITKEAYNNLLRDSIKLNLLERGGVGNWEWYDDSLEEYQTVLEEEGLN